MGNFLEGAGAGGLAVCGLAAFSKASGKPTNCTLSSKCTASVLRRYAGVYIVGLQQHPITHGTGSTYYISFFFFFFLAVGGLWSGLSGGTVA